MSIYNPLPSPQGGNAEEVGSRRESQGLEKGQEFIFMNTAKQLVETAVKGIQEKKGKKIRIVDLSGIDGSICQYFVICEGNSPSQVDAIAESIEDTLRIDLHEKPVHIVGKENSMWVALDYVDIMVHIFLPEAHDFYNLENLWQDAPIEEIEDLD